MSDDDIDTDEFARDLAAAAAKQLIKLARARGKVSLDDVARLQDTTSLFSPYTFDHMISIMRDTHGLKIVKNMFTTRRRKK